MKIKKATWSKILVILLLCLSNISKASLNKIDFLGDWCWIKNDNNRHFAIVIKYQSGIYKGAYYSVLYGGNLIDNKKNAFVFKTYSNNTVTTKIQAGISQKYGTIRLVLLNDKTMKWVVIKPPKGEFYTPKRAILKKC